MVGKLQSAIMVKSLSSMVKGIRAAKDKGVLKLEALILLSFQLFCIYIYISSYVTLHSLRGLTHTLSDLDLTHVMHNSSIIYKHIYIQANLNTLLNVCKKSRPS